MIDLPPVDDKAIDMAVFRANIPSQLRKILNELNKLEKIEKPTESQLYAISTIKILHKNLTKKYMELVVDNS
jgi:hypothetical protein